MPLYCCYQLVIETPFECPVLPLAAPDAAPTVRVIEGEVPLKLEAAEVEEMAWQAAPGQFLLRAGPKAGRFLVRSGQPVQWQRGREAQDEILAFCFMDRVLAAILRLQGYLVLHANAAVGPDGRAVAVSGTSGAGKSTTLAGLLERGYRMLSDDITALRLDGAGRLEVLPGIPQYHLTEDSAQMLGQDLNGLTLNRWKRMKAAVPAQTVMAAQAAPLRGIFTLTQAERENLEVKELSGAAKFAALQDCLYGPICASEHPRYFPLFNAFLEQVGFTQLTRPSERWSLDEVLEAITRG